MKKHAIRSEAVVLALAVVLGLIAAGLPSADAGGRCLSRISLANGGDRTVEKVVLNITRPKGGHLKWQLGAVKPGTQKAWKPSCCVTARSVTALLCLGPEESARTKAALMYRFPMSDRDNELLGDGYIEAIDIFASTNEEGHPGGQLVVRLTGGRLVARMLARVNIKACSRQDIVPEDAYPFVRIRLKSNKPGDKKILRAEARGSLGMSADTQVHVLPNDPPELPIPEFPYSYSTAGAYSAVLGTSEANSVKMCVQLDLNDNGVVDDGEYFTGTFDPGDVSCRIDRVDFDVTGNTGVTAYVVLYADTASWCGSLTPAAQLPNSHKTLKVKMIELVAGDDCAFGN